MGFFPRHFEAMNSEKNIAIGHSNEIQWNKTAMELSSIRYSAHTKENYFLVSNRKKKKQNKIEQNNSVVFLWFLIHFIPMKSTFYRWEALKHWNDAHIGLLLLLACWHLSKAIGFWTDKIWINMNKISIKEQIRCYSSLLPT